MSESFDEAYEAMIGRVIAEITANPTKFMIASDVTQHLLPFPEYQAQNRRVMIEARDRLKISPAKFESAMNKRRKELEAAEKALKAEEARQAAQQQSQERMKAHAETQQAMLGGQPTDARQFVALFAAHKALEVRYSGECVIDGETKMASKVEADILLTAETLKLTLPPAKVMTTSGLKLAFEEYIEEVRECRKQVVWDRIKECTDGRKAPAILQAFRDNVCERMFREPEFAMRGLLKIIWQVKRKMLGLPIKHHHCVVGQGVTETGKSALMRMIIAPIKELAVETSTDQVVDDRNFHLKQYYLVFIDELSKADKADVNKLKNLITGADITARVLYTHRTQTVPIHMTLVGTADKPVASSIYDEAGMRRFVEVHPKQRKEIEPYWSQIADFDYLGLWQAVDPYSEDPLMSVFEHELRRKQEDMRALSNVEAWAAQFIFSPKDPSGARKEYVPGSHVEFYAQSLFEHSFRSYEERFHPGSRGTSITTWGSSFKYLIENKKVLGWTHREMRNVSLYRLDLSSAASDADASHNELAPERGLTLVSSSPKPKSAKG